MGRNRGFRGIRSIDPLRDMRSVVRLIDDAFGGELSPTAQRTLHDLRWLSRTAWLLGPFLWMTPSAHLFSGFVWVEGRQIVGNVTVTSSHGGGPGCWVISNVVVDRAYRGQGIGRALMKEALSHIHCRNGRRVALQVRADNCAAVHLYRDMGFVAVDTLLEMHMSSDRFLQCQAQIGERIHGRTSRRGPRAQRASLPFQRRGYDEWYQEYLLAREAVPTVSQHIHPVQQRSFRIEWDERVSRWLRNQVGDVREYRLGIREEGELCAALTVWAGRWRPNHRLEILVHPRHRGRWEEGLVDYVLTILQQYPLHPIYTEVHAVHDALVRELEACGFVIDRELEQMELDLASNP
jgi:ribosomal protein S18 acetylase RimI-like enzyme